MKTDEELQVAVHEELLCEPTVVATDIVITVKGGVVTLLGTVGSYAEKWSAERTVERVSGEPARAEGLKVSLSSSNQRNDFDIAAAALHTLAWDVLVPEQVLKLEVENGFVTLSGEVEWSYQREAAERDVRTLMGVVGLLNDITVKPSASPKNVATTSQAALLGAPITAANGLAKER